MDIKLEAAVVLWINYLPNKPGVAGSIPNVSDETLALTSSP